MIDYSDAIDEIYSKFWEAFQVFAPPLVGYLPAVQWRNKEVPGTADGSKFWVRVSYQTIDSAQSSLSVCIGEPGKKSYTNLGFLTFQVFAPKSLSASDKILKQLSAEIRNTFRSARSSGGIWFRNPRIVELPPEELFYRNNVIVEYRFDELG